MVCLCVASRAALVTSDRRVRSCRTAPVPLIILTFRTLHQPHFLSASLVVRTATARHCTLRYTANVAVYTPAPLTTLRYVHMHCSRTFYWCLECCCRTVTAHLAPTPNSPPFRFYLRNVGVSFNKPEADGTVIGHAFWTSKLIRQPLVSSKFNIQFYGSVINLRN